VTKRGYTYNNQW